MGFTATLERYALHLLAGSHFRDRIRPRVVVLCPDAPAAAARFAAANPGADSLSPLRFESTALEPAAIASAPIGDPIAIVVDAGDDAATIALGQALADNYAAAGQAPPPIHLRLATAPALDDPMLRPFGCLDRFADPELLLQEDHDALARAIHDFYLQGRFDEGEKIGARGSLAEWEDLPERFRDDNRLVADCYALKLRDIGARVVAGAGPPMRIEAEELEELSRAEHDRWMGAKLKDGWRHADRRDDAARLHPDIVPYDALSERVKDLDREQVRAITRMLSAAGQRALRTLVVAIDPLLRAAPEASLDAVVAALATHYPDRVPLFAGDPATHACALLAAADARGLPTLLTLAGDTRGLAASEAAAGLVRRADTIVAHDGGGEAWLLAHAHLRLTDGPGAAPDAIVLAPNGSIAHAPWAR